MTPAPLFLPEPTSLRPATRGASISAAIWFLGFTLTILSYNHHNPTSYDPRDHFISELGFPGTSPLTWVFNLTLATSAFISWPIVAALAAHLQTRLATIAARTAQFAFICASFLGLLGLGADLYQPEHLSFYFLRTHGLAAGGCFLGWTVSVALFTTALGRLPASAHPPAPSLLATRYSLLATSTSLLRPLGVICVLVAFTLFLSGYFTAQILYLHPLQPDPVLQTMLRSAATPAMLNAWLAAHRPDLRAPATLEWLLLATMFAWHGAVLVFLHRRSSSASRISSS